jgi:hypothetical protein
VVSHHFHIFTLEHIDSDLNRYEWIEMVLLHKSLFASKWMQAMRTALGGTFTGDNAFALLYVMYNPVCRRDIHQKKRQANQMLAEALLPVELEYSGRQKNFLFYIKSSWAVFKFAIQNRALADCNPTLVLSASKYAHAAIFKDLNRILWLVENCERDAQTNWHIARNSILAKSRAVQAWKKIPVNFQNSQAPFDHDENHDARRPLQTLHSSVTWLQQIQNCWKRKNRIVPTQIENQQRQDDAPKLFVDQFDLKRAFVEENIDEEARLSLLTLMIFPDAEDFGLSRDCKGYKKQFDKNLESFRSAFRALFRLSKELKSVDPSETLTRKERIFQRISDMLFGEEMKLLRNFYWLADEKAVELFHRHQFPELETEFERIPSVDEVLKQLVAKDMNTSMEDPTIGSQSQAPKGTHENVNPSTILKFATHEPSERRAAERTDTAPAPLAAAKVSGPNAARSRPTMYSSQSILAAARVSAGIGRSNVAGLLQQDITTSSEDAVMRAELSRTLDDNSSLAEQVKALEANARDALVNEANAQEESLRVAERLKSMEAKEADLLQRAADAESKVLALSAQVTDLQALSSAKSKPSDIAANSAELSRARDTIVGLVEQVKGLEANLQIETANALAKEAASQEKLLHLAERLKSMEAKEADLLQRAADAESKVLALSAQVTDLQALSSAKSKPSDIAANSAELSRARDTIVGLVEQVKGLEANLQIETAKEAASQEKLLHLAERLKSMEAKEAESLRWPASAIGKVSEHELLQLRAEAKEPEAVAMTSTAPATELQGAQQASKSLQIDTSAADDQALAVDAESEQVALDQRSTIRNAKADADTDTNAAGLYGMNAESLGWKASGGGAVAAAGQPSNLNLSYLQTKQPTLPFLQAPSWKQNVSRARKDLSPFKEVSQLLLLPCSDCIKCVVAFLFTASRVCILFDANNCLTIVRQFLVLSIMQKGLHQTEALASFLQSSKQAFAERNPAASLDDAEADQIIQELWAELHL